ncbi:hypothetical protein HAX54_000156 [Datura stramonium]|uniref:Uncharacterized protein n=1 Tax=Datura stramonium TaxID=4076 RepID=A0ABS8WTF8_DATST|nr:hypothetical protein [Datura stramonium]
MEEIMYEFGFSSSGGGGNYSDDHNLLAAEYFGWPTAFSDGAVPMESVGNVMAREVLSAANNSVVVDNTCSNLQEDQKNNIQAKISSHPLFPKLLLTYLDCHKVGAPTEIVNMLDNIVQENDLYRRSSSTALNRPISDDSELDDFMVSYCDVLAKFKSDLARSFNEATTFLNDVQTQLTNLCTTTNISEGES